MAGLVLIKEFMNWTKEEALDAYRLNIGVQYALNLEPVARDYSDADARTADRSVCGRGSGKNGDGSCYRKTRGNAGRQD